MQTRTKRPHPESPLEATLALHLRACKLPEFEREHVFAPPRRYRFDLAALAGWRVLRFTAAMVRDGRALETIRKAIGGSK
jgi:hypothetical protein